MESILGKRHREAASPSPSPSPSPSLSGSRLVCETVKGMHIFTVQGFSLLKGVGPGNYVKSDTFTAGGYEWAVYFYPEGKSAENNSVFSSVFIALVGEGVDVRALFEIVMVDQSGQGRHKLHSHFRRKLEGGPYTLKNKGSMWGYKRYYRRSSLETSHYVKEDCLIMHCKVGVVRSRVEAPAQFPILVPKADMGCCLKKLLDWDIGYDIVFEVGEEKIKAHKQIFAARSRVFMDQFFGPLADPKLDRVIITGMEPSIFKAVLLFIYTDELPDTSKLTTSICKETTISTLQHLLEAADRYDLKRLKRFCEAKLSEKLTPRTVSATLALAERHQCPQLNSVCLKLYANEENLGGDS